MEKRLILDAVSEDTLLLFLGSGCSVKHKLKNSLSFNCPKEFVPPISARESRVFRILDLEADVQIGADKVWLEGINGSSVNVAILDTGIDSAHIDINDSIKGQKDFVDNDDVAEDPNGHGTHVAGIITANGVFKNIIGTNDATGVSPGAGVYMLRVCRPDGTCLEDDIIAAMEYAVNNLDAKIMSLSLGGGNFGTHCDSDPLAAKANWVVDNGIIVVATSGNSASGVSSPACGSKVIAVGAADKNGVPASWSNTGPALDILAPGVGILSTYSCLALGNCNFYWYASLSGTSMAAPHVSGVIALMLDANPGLTVNEIKNALYSTADPLAPVLCWSRRNNYMASSSTSQLRKFCKCAQGSYAYTSYRYSSLRTGGYRYANPYNNENWRTESASTYYPVYSVRCSDGNWYDTNKDYYFTSQAGIVDAQAAYLSVKPATCEPSPEICDGVDNDCDNIIDEGFDTGASCSAGVGACQRSGVKICSLDGSTTVCDAISGTPTTETCNGIDDDCDGITDENIDGNACSTGLPGVCSSGTTACVSGSLICQQNNQPSQEICNSLDDDCNGEIDEGNVCTELCWEGDNKYLWQSSSNLRKFCKCAEGNYMYVSYRYRYERSTAYRYVNSSNNMNWTTEPVRTFYPAFTVKCGDGNWYSTNQDYYFG